MLPTWVYRPPPPWSVPWPRASIGTLQTSALAASVTATAAVSADLTGGLGQQFPVILLQVPKSLAPRWDALVPFTQPTQVIIVMLPASVGAALVGNVTGGSSTSVDLSVGWSVQLAKHKPPLWALYQPDVIQQRPSIPFGRTPTTLAASVTATATVVANLAGGQVVDIGGGNQRWQSHWIGGWGMR